MARKLQDALINTKRFQVVTRDLGDLEQELAFQHHSGMVSPSTAAQFGRKLGTQLVLTATVTDFEDTTSSNQNHASRSRPSSGNNPWKNMAAGVVGKLATAGKTYIAMNVQVVDVQSGEIVASKQVSAAHKDTSMTAAVTGEMLGADIRSWDTLPRGKALRDVIDQTVAFLAEPGGLPNAYFTAPAFNVTAARQKIEPDQLSLKMQRALQGLGYYHGAIDGMIGPQTAAAIEQFQKDYNLTVTGFFDPPTTKKLLELASSN
jgi:curli biogenesis system outer membrane secretion channel CsgG